MDSFGLWKRYDRSKVETVACVERWAKLVEHLDSTHPLVLEAQCNWENAVTYEMNSFSAWIRSEPQLAEAVDRSHDLYRQHEGSAEELAAQAYASDLIACREQQYREVLAMMYVHF